MRKLFTLGLLLSLFATSAVSFAGRGGTLDIVNGTGYTLRKINTTGVSSMNHWNLPDEVKAQSVESTYFEFKYQRKWYVLWIPTIWTNRGHAETLYAAYCPNGKTDNIRITSKVVDNKPILTANALSNDCVNLKPVDGQLGFNHNGHVVLTVENKNGISLLPKE